MLSFEPRTRPRRQGHYWTIVAAKQGSTITSLILFSVFGVIAVGLVRSTSLSGS
jgi:hypothetical protein